MADPVATALRCWAGVVLGALALCGPCAAEDVRQLPHWPMPWRSMPQTDGRWPTQGRLEAAAEVWPSRPLRRLELVNGETLYVELLRFDDGLLEFRWRGRNRIRMSWDRVARVASLPGVVDVLDESFESTASATTPFAHSGLRCLQRPHSSPPYRYEFPTDLTAGQIQWVMRAESAGTGHVTLHLGDNALELAASSNVQALQLPAGWVCDFRQSLPSTSGWTAWACSWGDDRWRVQRGRDVLAAGTGAGPPTAVQFDADAGGTVCFDDVHVQRLVKPQRDAAYGVEFTAFIVELPGGDMWYGDQIFGTGQRWSLRRGEQTMPLDWSECTAIRYGGVASGRSSQWLSGSVARLECSPPDWPPGLPAETWVASVESRTGGLVHCVHPLLGNVVVAERELRAVERLGASRFVWLHPGRVHLGDELRREFHQPLPHGRTASGTFAIASPPRGRWYVSLSVAELEPSGPSTPPSEPFRDAVRQGGLRTELFVNGQLVGDLNRLLNWRPPVAHPERVRLEVPRAVLQVGENRWEIRQQPLAAGDERFDDCELGRMVLEREL